MSGAEPAIRIVFHPALAPAAERAPVGIAVEVPAQIMEARLDLEERLFLDYLVKETYGEHRLEMRASLGELAAGIARTWDGRRGWEDFRDTFTPEWMEATLAKFERLGFLHTLRLVEPPATA